MIVSDRLRALREEKDLSQADIEKRSGLLRCYVSRIENGHSVPAIETLEKMARALEVPLYQLLYEGDEPPTVHAKGQRRARAVDDAEFSKFHELFGKMTEDDRQLLLLMARQLALKKAAKAKKI